MLPQYCKMPHPLDAFVNFGYKITLQVAFLNANPLNLFIHLSKVFSAPFVAFSAVISLDVS